MTVTPEQMVQDLLGTMLQPLYEAAGLGWDRPQEEHVRQFARTVTLVAQYAGAEAADTAVEEHQDSHPHLYPDGSGG